MATGLKIPIGVNSSGGAELVSGDENDSKIIKLALSNDDNENAFQQDIGLGEDMVFDLSDPTTKSKIAVRIQRIFSKFQAEKRYKLLRNTIKWTDDSETQETTLEFRYLNMESDEVQEYEQKFGAGA
jgi:hypothetical protein